MNSIQNIPKLVLVVLSALVVVIAVFGIYPHNPTAAQAADTYAKQGKKKIKYWAAPMDPTYIRNQPGKSPMGMDLVPVYEDEEGSRSSASVIKIDPVMVQNMGVRVVELKRGSISRKVRTLGEVEVAEDQLSVVNLRFSGWIEKIYADETGQAVKRGQALFSIYSPELLSAQKEYLLAYNASGKNSALARAAADRVLLWGIPRSVLDKVVAAQNVDRNLVVRAPRSGFILHKTVVAGARIKAGSDLYRIGNLKKIWVIAEVYEFDAPWIRVGQKATMELSFQRGKTFEGIVNYIYPTLTKKSRTLRVRLEFPNPGIGLKPGMFATVRIEAQRKDDVLVIPTEAIIHSGERQIVFVTKKIGRYEPREIVTGLVGDDRRTEVLSGLMAGETVVTSGQFMLDSESQLQEAVQKLLAARLQAKEAGLKTSTTEHRHAEDEDRGTSYWTCGMHPNIVQEGPGSCPICGMNLVEKKQ
ncbi:MAG: efflux RND transporter periplasmic adaptor subunit [Deltaproteobacteria bacterium]|nr:efflux RND transporter periplasmic adaptor subunit [Deltaproteobacteria bacterium]